MSGPSRARLTLPANKRLGDSRVFARLKLQGRRMSAGSIIVNWEVLPPDGSSQLGVITSRKLGNAVVRARARRLLREVFRRHQHELNRPARVILIPRASMVNKPYKSVEQDYLRFMRQAGLCPQSL
jgi:ribonuclease P protein component